MYIFSYSEVLSDGPATARAAESEVIERSIELMEAAERAGMSSRESIEAVYFVNRVWCHFIEDLGRPDNDLPQDLRAKLISIGIFLIKTADEIRSGTATSFRGMIEISRAIAMGLK